MAEGCEMSEPKEKPTLFHFLLAPILIAIAVGCILALGDVRYFSTERSTYFIWLASASASKFFEFMREVLLRFIPWPLVVLVIFFSLGSGRVATILRYIVRRLKRLKVGGSEMELTTEDKAEVELDARRFKSEVQSYRALVLIEMSRLVKEKGISQCLLDIIDGASKNTLDRCPVSLPKNWRKNLRVTIHVPDFVFADRLVQLVDYVGNGSNGTAGRTISMRQGIVGKVWRGQKPILVNDVLNGSDPDDGIPTDVIVSIVQDWGMMKDEAYKAAEYRSCFAMPIFEPLSASEIIDQIQPKILGILYLDSTSANQFKPKREGVFDEHAADLFRDWLIERLVVVRLREAMSDIFKKMESLHSGITLAV